jgi:tRNA U54 and U55 pseudouridine synthase Pus10
MKRRERWRTVLDAEAERWSKKSCDQLRSELKDLCVYEIEFESINHQIEVELLENTDEYVHVLISVDDGTLPASLSPVSCSFVQRDRDSQA